MTLVVLAALGTGLGFAGVAAGLAPRRRSLEATLAVLDGEAEPDGRNGRHRRDLLDAVVRPDRRLGDTLARAIGAGSAMPDGLRTALAVTGRPLAEVCRQAVVAGAAGALLPVLAWGVLTTAGVRLPILVPAWVALVGSGGGVALVALDLRADARTARVRARRVVSSYLDLVVLALAGGMGVEGALHAAADVGDDPTSARIAGALALARDRGVPPWDALRILGAEIGVPELEELAAAVGLAGTEGARVRATLAAKSASIRRHELADAETEANTITERLFLPGALLLVGFLVFIGYPAVARIATGL